MVAILYFLSGLTALVYEVLWLKQLGLLFGSTAEAAAVTVAVFFGGLSLGSHLWGRRAARTAEPLRVYGWLEIGVAATAAGYFALYAVHQGFYPLLFSLGESSPALRLLVRLLLAASLLLPPAILMGGAFPMIGQHAVRRAADLGRLGAWLYAVNLAGAAVGALLAGFYLPIALGFRRSYLAAMVLNVGIGVVALALARGARARPATAAGERPTAPAAPAAEQQQLLALAFLSGFASLGVEVLWVRMFAQVLHNSVYSFSIILFTFLAALGIGAAVAHALARSRLAPERVIVVLLVAAGLLAGTSPLVFDRLTGGLDYIAPLATWHGYVVAVVGHGALVMLPAGVAVGAVFPYLLRLAEGGGGAPGTVIGRLAAVNTVGGVLGSLAAGFVLLPWLGLWGSLRALAALYCLAAVLLPPGGSAALRLAPAGALLALLTVLDPTRLPLVRVDPVTACVHQTWEGGDAVVAVVRESNNLRIKVDNYYSLGGTASRSYEETQADIPLVLHPDPRRVYFLGLGTGITAGAAVRHGVEQVTVSELLPDVIEASRLHFALALNGLFEDPRARVVAEDGRSHLLASRELYDVIVADLFIPWQAGAGALYSREHFESVRARLAPGGIFAQWLPLYQLSREEAFVIARTMQEVFPQVTVWRGDFLADSPIVALIGQRDPAPLDPEAMARNFGRRKGAALGRDDVLALMGLFYAGNLAAPGAIPAETPVNTDDLPIIEYSAPVSQRRHWGEGMPWFTGAELAAWYESLAGALPPARDPYLARLTAAERGFVEGGLDLYAANVAKAAGDQDAAERRLAGFRAKVPARIGAALESSAERAPGSVPPAGGE